MGEIYRSLKDSENSPKYEVLETEKLNDDDKGTITPQSDLIKPIKDVRTKVLTAHNNLPSPLK